MESKKVKVTRVPNVESDHDQDSSLLLVLHAAVKEAAAQINQLNQNQLRQQLEVLYAEIKNNRENGVDPLLIFPEEIWTHILEYIQASHDDQLNCSRTCKLFQRIVGHSKAELLFVKVMPILAADLNCVEIPKCRLVCTKWQHSVDNYLENYLTLGSTSNNFGAYQSRRNDSEDTTMRYFERQYGYSFALPTTTYNEEHVAAFRRAIKKHPRNPFIGRMVEVRVQSPDSGNHPAFFPEFKSLMYDLGKHIHHFCLSGAEVTLLSLSSIYAICVHTLKKCDILKTFRLNDWDSHTKWSLPHAEIIQAINSAPCLPDNHHLESLASNITNPNGFIVLDRLIGMYCRQLKNLELHLWNTELYHELQWTNLQELRVWRGNSVALVNSLMQIRAPMLRYMCIRLDRSEVKIENLVTMVSNIPTLEHLHLKISAEFPGFSDSGIRSLSPNLITTGRVRVLELTIPEHNIGYNFLICFPFLKKLLIRHGHHIADKYNLDDGESFRINWGHHGGLGRHYVQEGPDFDWDAEDEPELQQAVGNESGSEDENDVEINDDYVRNVSDSENFPVMPEQDDDDDSDPEIDLEGYIFYSHNFFRYSGNDLVQISQFIPKNPKDWDEDRKMYMSNVWKVLPYLRLLETEYADADYGNGRRVYTRELYNKEKVDQLQQLKERLDLLKSLEIDRIKKAKEDGSKGHANFNLISADTMMGTHAARCTIDSILPFVVKMLPRKDLLSCRVISRIWCSTVDKYMEQQDFIQAQKPKWVDTLRDQRSQVSNEFGICYSFGVPSNIGSRRGQDRFIKLMTAHSRNPFIGRTVVFKLKPSDEQYDLSEVKRFLDCVGKHIWNLTILGSDKNYRMRYTYYRLLCLEIVNRCKNLRRLCLGQAKFQDTSFHPVQILPRDTPTFTSLENLEVLDVYGVHWNIYQVVCDLLEKNSSQLKSVSLLDKCNFEYYQWSNLEQLHILSSESDKWLKSLKKTEAPNLKTLQLKLDGYGRKLQLLIDISNQFPKLTKLQLQFAQGISGMYADEAINVSPNSIFSDTLTTLTLSVNQRCDLSYDFLIYFPNLKRLNVRLHYEEEHWLSALKRFQRGEDDEEEDFAVDNSRRLLDISDYFWKETDPQEEVQRKMYQSNIWKMLPSIQVLEVQRDRSVELKCTRKLSCKNSCAVNFYRVKFMKINLVNSVVFAYY